MKLLKKGVIVLTVLVVLGVGAFAYLGVQSRSGAALGLIDGKLAACPASPNCVSSEAGAPAEKSVAPLSRSAWNQIPAVLGKMGGKVTVKDDAYLAAEFGSSLFGFVDDVEFRLTDTDVQVRSASRVGYSDAGVNAARVAALREKLGE